MRIILSLLLLSSAWGLTNDIDERIESISLNKRNFDEIDDSTSSVVQLTTLRDADEGVVNGECHNLGLHGDFKKEKKKKKKKFDCFFFFFFFFFF
jgi:hypothetical protein